MLMGNLSIETFKYYIDKDLKRAQLYIDKGIKGKELHAMLVKNPVDQAALSASPSKGADDAPITLIDFGDFECPPCSEASRALNTLLNEPEFSGKFKVYFKHRIAMGHSFAQKAAEASMFAHQSGKFWELHDLLFINQDNLSIRDLKQYAAQIGLNATELEQALKKNTYKESVDTDAQLGADLAVSSIPAFLINGKLYRNTSDDHMSYERVKEIFRKSIDRVRIDAENNVCQHSTDSK